MRMRRNANISELLKSTSSSNTHKTVQTYNCQLNQSPWDVMSSFSLQSIHPNPPPPPLSQAKGNGVLTINGSSSLSILKRFNLQLGDNQKFNGSSSKRDYSNGGKDENQRDNGHRSNNFCCKTDGKSWLCRNEAVKGSSMCKHHSPLEKISGDKKQVVSSETGKRRPRPKKVDSPNLNEFYYYSGFGPRWNKKRGEGNDMGKNSECEHDIDPMALYKFVEEDLNYSENEDDEVEEKHGRKRMRKPIKERSLKSLM